MTDHHIDYDTLCDMNNEDLIEYIGNLQSEVSILNARLTNLRNSKEKTVFVQETVSAVKSNRMSTTLVLEYVDPSLALKPFFSGDTAVVNIDEHTNLGIHIKKEQAVLLLEWARNLVKSFDNKENETNG